MSDTVAADTKHNLECSRLWTKFITE